MKEIDTESPVVWPAWCYSGNITTDLSKHSPITSASLSPSPSSSETGGIVVDSVTNKFHTRRKSQFTTKQLAVESVNGIQFSTERNNINSHQNHHQYSIAIPSSSSSTSSSSAASASSSLLLPTSSALSSVIGTLPVARQSSLVSVSASGSSSLASASIVQQLTTTTNDNNKMLSDRMLLGFNVIDNNNSNNKTKHCDNNSSYVYLEKVKNETQMDATRDGNELVNNNNNHNNSNNLSNNINNLDCNNINNNNNNNNNSNNSNNNNNCVKRERLSPATNGDLQNVSRSRSATPSSFRGTPPQATNSNDLGIQNLSTNLLSSMQNRNNDFSSRNYSDFMRSLAAKYNNSNPNNSNASRRKIFESKTSMQKGNNKDLASPTNEQKSSIPDTPTNPTVPPFVSTFLSSLPFSPIIDMSSTQALVTLARAAKEAELQNILRNAQKRPSTSSGHGHSPRSSNLTAALQQAAQFIAPSILYSAQFQTPTHHTPSSFRQQQHQQSPSPKQSSVTATEKTTITTTTTASPLDLSSAPQTKRFKSESTSSSDRSPSQEPNQLPTALVHKSTAKSPCNLSESTATAGSVNVGAHLMRSCQSQSAEVNSWTVDEVCNFVASIDICAEYVQNFRDQCIDGSGLPLLTEDHLMNSLRMKLGPALKLRSMLVKKLGGPCPCVSCTTQAQQILATQTAVTSSATASASTLSSQISPQTQRGSCSQIINQNQHQYSHNNQNSANININNNNSNNNCNNNNLSTCNSQLANSSVTRPASADSGS